MTTIQLIASDLDGTLLNSNKEISARTRAAVTAAHSAGLILVVATGRQLDTMPPNLPKAELDFAVASNGAVGFDYTNQQVLFVEQLAVSVQAQIVEFLSAAVPGVVFGAGRGLGATFMVQPQYVELTTAFERLHDRREYVLADVQEVIAEPTIKLVARHPEQSANMLYECLQDSGVAGFHATTSGAAFVEISAAGVNKASGLAKIAELTGIPAAEVAAVGDAKNDVEMLNWAGVGLAVANAVPETLAAANQLIPSNDEDGLAQFIEGLLGSAGNR